MSETLDFLLAQRYFQEAAAMFAQDNGRLWGVSLDGPLLLVDYETRQVVANRPDMEGFLAPRQELWTGQIPHEIIVANTAATWAGVHWTMILWQSLSEDPQQRAEFIAHEAFHRIQGEIGLPWPQIPDANTHLDTFDGRYWLQLEWRALARALTEDGRERVASLEDALLFRARRRSLFDRAAVEERSLEMHEGMAEYTGFKLSQMSAAQAAEHLRAAPTRYPSFVRSFAYASGPAYGLLLDHFHPDWRRGLTPEQDVGELLQTALSVALPADLAGAAGARAPAYDGEALRHRELERDRRRQAEIAAYHTRLLEGPVLMLPISGDVQCAFDPRATIPMPQGGTVFPFIKVSDVWGVLDVERDGLWMNGEWRRAHVAAPERPEEPPLSGNGWRLQLASGWEIRPVRQTGSWEVVTREE